MSDALTPREQEIYDFLVAGSTPKEIAYSLNLTYNTVNSHQKNIYEKLGVHSTRELLVKAREASAGISSTPEGLIKRKIPITSFMWVPICEESSKVNITVTNEKIDGKDEICAVMTGNKGHTPEAWVGVSAYKPDTKALQNLKTMKIFSLKVLGDGNLYTIRFLIPETINDGDQWQAKFITEEDKITTINVKIPEDLFRIGFSGKKVDFIQSNLVTIHIQAENPGSFNLKFWDIKWLFLGKIHLL